MPEKKTASPSPSETCASPVRRSSWPIFTYLLVSVLVAVLVYQLESYDPVPLPFHELTQPPLLAPMKNDRILQGSEYVGAGQLKGPEDIAYDSRSGLIYTTCADGWIKRVTVNDSVTDSIVENLVNTGGRPLGIVLGHDGEVIVADAYKGLLRVKPDGDVELLTNHADGQKFNLTDGVDIADDGTIYFTDASYKYSLEENHWDLLEGRPYGRLMSYDSVTKQTKVLARDLYFPNGLAVSPSQDSVVFCETTMRRCRRFYIKGEKMGRIEKFIDNLPGMPDNIRYADGYYWIGLATEITAILELSYAYPFLRKMTRIMGRYIDPTSLAKNAGVFVVDMKGKPTAHYHDPGLAVITGGVQIGTHLYCGSITYPHILRLDLAKYPARATTSVSSVT